MKFIPIALFLFFTISQSFGQRNYPHQKSISVLGGKGELSGIMGGGYTYNTSSKISLGADLLFEFGKYKTINFTQVHLLPAFHYTIFNLKIKEKETIFFKIGGGVMINYNKVNFDIEGKKPSGLNFGAHASVLSDIYLNDNLILFASLKQGYQAAKVMGHWPYFALAGLKFNL